MLVRTSCAGGQGRRLRGKGWVGGWVYAGDKAAKPDEGIADFDALAALIDRTYAAVAERVCSDWDVRPPRRRLPILAGRFDSVAGLLKRIGVNDGAESDRWKRGLYWRGAVFLVGRPESDEFQYVLAHEMCHALCDTVLGVDHTVPWASEGYAEYVAQVTAWNADAQYTNTVAQVAAIKYAIGARLPELLTATRDDAKHPLYYEVAAMFVYYLRELSRVEPRAWAFLREALTSGSKDHPPDLLTLKIATGYSLEELQRGFEKFCDRESERLNARPLRMCYHLPGGDTNAN